MTPLLLPSGTYFVSGIDTDCGKSYATGVLARMLGEAGRQVITQKFIQTGNTAESEDIVLHRRLMGIPMQSVDLDGTTCPIIYPFPASPHLSASLVGKCVDIHAIEQATARLKQLYDTVLIEGAGGIMVPLQPFYSQGDSPHQLTSQHTRPHPTPHTPSQYLTIDYIADHKLPLLFVSSAKLGSLNHTLLSLEACRSRGIEIAAVLWKLYPEGDSVIAADTRNYIGAYLKKYYPTAIVIDIPKSE